MPAIPPNTFRASASFLSMRAAIFLVDSLTAIFRRLPGPGPVGARLAARVSSFASRLIFSPSSSAAPGDWYVAAFECEGAR